MANPDNRDARRNIHLKYDNPTIDSNAADINAQGETTGALSKDLGDKMAELLVWLLE